MINEKSNKNECGQLSEVQKIENWINEKQTFLVGIEKSDVISNSGEIRMVFYLKNMRYNLANRKC